MKEQNILQFNGSMLPDVAYELFDNRKGDYLTALNCHINTGDKFGLVENILGTQDISQFRDQEFKDYWQVTTMKTGHVCKECDKTFSSQANLYAHKREKHTFFNTIEMTCTCCLQIFNSVVFNTIRNNNCYTKCEECRDLQKLLCTNDLVHNTYVYGPLTKP